MPTSTDGDFVCTLKPHLHGHFNAGARVLVADVSIINANADIGLDTSQPAPNAHLEILGFWRHDDLVRRIELIERRGPGNVVLAVSRKLRGSKEALSDAPAWVIDFAEVLPPKKVIETCGRSPLLRIRKSIESRAVLSSMRAVPLLPWPSPILSSPYS